MTAQTDNETKARDEGYEVRKGEDGTWGIFLRSYNIRIATFAPCTKAARDNIAAALSQSEQPAVVGDGPDYATVERVARAIADVNNVARSDWRGYEADARAALAALTPAATPGDGPVSASDWRDLYRLQTAMRYMDCNANLTRDTAYSMADADISRIEAAAQKEGNGNG